LHASSQKELARDFLFYLAAQSDRARTRTFRSPTIVAKLHAAATSLGASAPNSSSTSPPPSGGSKDDALVATADEVEQLYASLALPSAKYNCP